MLEQTHVSRPSSSDIEAKQETPDYGPLKTPPHEAVFVIVVCAAQLMTQAGLSLSIAPLQIISASFNSTPRDLTWASAAYSLTVGTFIFVSGRLGDVYGHKLLFVIGFLWFGLWSLIAGFSVWSNPRFFDCCRAFQGIGPALLLPNAVAILGRSYPPGRRKGMVFCLFGAVAPGGFTLGGTFSSLLAERLWWPWAYWILAIACVVFAILGYFIIPAMEQEPLRPDLSTFDRLDGLGAITGVSGLILINFAWNQAAVVGWEVPYTYALLIVGILVLGLFLFLEGRAAYPLLPRTALKGEVGWVLGCIAAGWSSFGILVFYYYEIMGNILGNSGLLVTAKWAGASASGACAAVITGLLLDRIPASIIMFIAMLAFTAGQALLASMPVGQIYWANAFVIMLVTPWGM
jgi:MFS family permease